jgi:hypothetical protein
MTPQRKRKLINELHQIVRYPLIDHTEFKRRGDDKECIYSYAYNFSLDGAEKLVKFCHEHKLTFYCTCDHNYNKNGTIRIVISEEGHREARKEVRESERVSIK